MNAENKKMKSQLNSKFRFPVSVNARRYNGHKLQYANYFDKDTKKWVVRDIDQSTENGGTMTPFNIQCNCPGACAIRNVVFKGDDTIVVFCDGDRVALHRNENDKNDPVTAILWALGQKVFGKNLVRQIHNVIQYRSIDAVALHGAKEKAEKA